MNYYIPVNIISKGMKILSAIIIDDEYHGRQNLSILLNKYCPEILLVGTASSASEGKELILKKTPEIVFLDINMPKVNGFELLNSLEEINFMLVIVSAHCEYGVQAIKINAIDYLLKPISIIELQNAVKKLHSYKNINSEKTNNTIHDKLLIPHFQGFHILDVKCITRLEADNNYTKIHFCDNKSITASKTLKEFEELLPEDCFLRVHKSDILNIDFITNYFSCDGGYAVMKDGSKVTISKAKKTDLLEKIRNHTKLV